MSYQERKNVVNMISSLLITGIYFWYVFRTHPEIGLSTEELLMFWSKTLLVLIPVSIVSKIVIHILFTITNAIATRENPPSTDERDRLIELKSSRISHFTFSFGFLMAMGALALGMSVNVMFIVLVISGLMTEMAEGMSQLYFYRRGI